MKSTTAMAGGRRFIGADRPSVRHRALFRDDSGNWFSFTQRMAEARRQFGTAAGEATACATAVKNRWSGG